MSHHGEETAPVDRPKGGGRGGRRPGAGRKPRGRFAPNQGDLAYAKDLISVLMRDESQPAGLRARCALAVLHGSAARCQRDAKGRSGPGDASSIIDGDNQDAPVAFREASVHL